MKALIVVDCQNDFITNALGSKEAQAIVPKVRALIEQYLPNDKIFFTLDSHSDNTYFETQEGKNLPIKHCIIGQNGWNISPDIFITNKYFPNVRYLYKNTFGYPAWEKESTIFENVDEIIICGLCTDICVIANCVMLKTVFPEIPITVVSNACAGTTSEKHEAALKVMESLQIKVI